MNTSLLIDNSYIENARIVCSYIDDDKVRNRAVANALAANLAAQFFESGMYTVDTESGLHNIGTVLQDIDISDIYVDGCYIDVRLYFEERELCVPKSHFDNNILPIAYMFIKVSQDLSHGEVTGFIMPKNVDTSNPIEGFYPVDAKKLQSFVEIATIIREEEPQTFVNSDEIFKYTESKIADKVDFYKRLILDYDGRIHLKKALKAQSVFDYVSVNDTVISQGETTEKEDEDLTLLFNENSDSEEARYDYSTEISPRIDTEKLMQETDSKEEQDGNINTLFTENTEMIENNVMKKPIVARKSKLPVVLLLLVLLSVLSGIGYYVYTQYFANSIFPNKPAPAVNNKSTATQKALKPEQKEPMPVESVEKIHPIEVQNEGNSVSIPAIEKNLDTSVLISNLKIDWEVPSGYISNNMARRYLVKLGKIIQLNLKSELLLLNKPPLTNKIVVELKYNNSLKKFETVRIVASSGESSVDRVITRAVDEALNIKLNQSTDVFNKLNEPILLTVRL